MKVVKETYFKYNELVNEINPLHFDKKYAQNLGFEKAVVAGIFLYSFIPKWLIDWIEDIEVIDKIDIRFKKPVYINDEIILQGTVKKIIEENNKITIECNYYIEKREGERVIDGKIYLSSSLQ